MSPSVAAVRFSNLYSQKGSKSMFPNAEATGENAVMHRAKWKNLDSAGGCGSLALCINANSAKKAMFRDVFAHCN